MSYVTKLLSTNERIVRVAREHWVTLLLPILVDGLICVVIISLSVVGIWLSPPWTWFGFLLLIVPLAHLGFRLWVWWNKQVVVTNRRIIQITGAFNKRVSDTLLEKINDIVMEQTTVGRILGFGDIELISGSESGTDVFHRLADPIGFKKALLDHTETPGGDGDDVSERVERALASQVASAEDVPELIAELDALRQQGAITDQEFKDKKRQLLTKIQ